MTEKLDEYSDVLSRLVRETVACTPKEWKAGTLTIDCDGTRIDYKLKNEAAPGKAAISEKLRDLIDELYVRMRQRGEVWAQAIIIFNEEAGNISFNTSFTYAGKSSQAQPAPVASSKKPWWKFGA